MFVAVSSSLNSLIGYGVACCSGTGEVSGRQPSPRERDRNDFSLRADYSK